MPPKATYGTDLMNRLSEGSLQQAAPDYVEEVREKVAAACEELIEIGARVRPLYVNAKPIGWVRGVHVTERKLLKKWYPEPWDFAIQMVKLATSFTLEELEAMTATELGRLTRLIDQMVTRDISLIPYLSAYSTTVSSEYLWHGKGKSVISFENKEIRFNDGKKITLLLPSDQARLWASLCTYREQAKQRLDDNYNSLMLLRGLVGRGANPVETSLKSIAKSLLTNNLDPWMRVIKVESKSLDDGWGHAYEADTQAGLLKELAGMVSDDRHERLIAKFEQQQRDEVEKEKKRVEELVAKRGEGVIEETIQVLSEAEVRRRELELRRGQPHITPVKREGENQTPKERLGKYK